jgi:hypothetical protein
VAGSDDHRVSHAADPIGGPGERVGIDVGS